MTPSPIPARHHTNTALAALGLTLALVGCGPSQQDASYASTAGTTPAATAAPATDMPTPRAPDEVKPPPIETPALPRTDPAPPRTASPAPSPAPVSTPQRVVQAPQAAPPARAVAQTVVQPVAKPAGQYGRVTSIEALRSEPKTNGSGAVIGGVLGGVLGHQIGGGSGRTAATAIGAIGGAVAGNQIEKNRSRDVIAYRVIVQLDNGRTRTVTVNTLDGLSQGDRVRYADGHLYHA